jgi:hypothetical protein
VSDHPFDRLARAHADGVSRREVIRASLAGAIGLYAAGPVHPLASAFARASRARRRGGGSDSCVACHDAAGRLTCGRCQDQLEPSVRQLLALAHRDRAHAKLFAYATTLGFKTSGGRKLSYMKVGRSYLAAVEQPLRTTGGQVASLSYIHRPPPAQPRSVSVLLVETPQVDEPFYGVTVDSHGRLLTVNPWSSGEVTYHGLLAKHGTPTARAATYESQICDIVAEQVCNAPFDKACEEGLAPLLAAFGCTEVGPAGFVACYLGGKVVCKLVSLTHAYTTNECQECVVTVACGCPPGETKCFTRAGSVCPRQCVDLQTDHNNCGACGNPCQSGEICEQGTCKAHCPNGCGACEYCDSATGTCQPECSSTQTCCQGVCHDPCPGGQTRDPFSCGCCFDCHGKCCGPQEVCCGQGCRPLCPNGQPPDPVTCECPPPQKIYCNCNHTCYTSAGTCTAECHGSLSCLSAVCAPAEPGQC